MLSIIFAIFCLYQIGNMQSTFSRIIVFLSGIFIMINIFAILIGKRYGKSWMGYLTKSFKNNFLRRLPFEIIKIIILLILIFSQYIYTGSKDANIQFKNRLSVWSEASDDGEFWRFIKHNSVFIPKCIKTTVNIMGEVEDSFDTYKESEEAFTEWAEDNIDRLREESDKCLKELEFTKSLMIILIIVVAFEKCLWIIRSIVRKLRW